MDFIARTRYLRRVRGPIEHDDFYQGIARQVVEQRTLRRLSQRELADLCGTTQSAIARFESGARPPKLDTLLRIAAALDCELTVTFRPRTSPKKESR